MLDQILVLKQKSIFDIRKYYHYYLNNSVMKHIGYDQTLFFSKVYQMYFWIKISKTFEKK